MPYRRAHWWVLLLLPATALAFWPSYLARLGVSSWVLHLHGITAGLWIALVAAQSWSIQTGRPQVHRLAGRASLALFPIFWVGGLLIVHMMAAGFEAADNPFHALYGARLTPIDLSSSAAELYLYHLALVRRRQPAVHGAAMLAILLFLLPPIAGRLAQIGGPFAIHGVGDFYKFAYAFDCSNLATGATGLWLYARRRRTAWPFLIVTGVTALQTVGFEVLAGFPRWQRSIASFGDFSIGEIIVVGFAVAVGVVWHGWTSTRGNRAGGGTTVAEPLVAA